MATQTFLIASYGDSVTVEIDVNDATWKPSKIRCRNNSIFPLTATILENAVQIMTITAPANQTTTWNISGIQLGWDAVDNGIILGNYSVFTTWPS